MADLKLSGIGITLWMAAVTAWFTTFVMLRNQWGATGDALSVHIPPGT